MKPTRTTLVGVALISALAGGCGRDARPDAQHDAQPAESALGTIHGEIPGEDNSQLSEHLSAAVIWAKLLASGARSDLPMDPLEEYAEHLDREVEWSMGLGSVLETGGLSGDPASVAEVWQRTASRLKQAWSQTTEVSAILHAPVPDRKALAHAAEAVADRVEAAGAEHDSLVGLITDPGDRFRMFALSLPHHELAVHQGALARALKSLGTGPDWPDRWREELPQITDELDDASSALTGLADRLDPLLDTYSRERRDDAFNMWTDQIRHAHANVQEQLRRLELELEAPRPDLGVALGLVGNAREEIEAAQVAHRKIAAELGQPYPDYDGSLDQGPRAPLPAPAPPSESIPGLPKS